MDGWMDDCQKHGAVQGWTKWVRRSGRYRLLVMERRNHWHKRHLWGIQSMIL